MEPKPVYMLNALWFKPDGGEAMYRSYLAKARSVMETLHIGARTHLFLNPRS